MARIEARSALRAFLDSEAAGGILLMAAAALALVVANSPLGDLYHHLLHAPLAPALTPALGPTTAHLVINDALMAVFFLLVGLEIKREFVDGRLSTWDRRRLPVIAALAGMTAPAIIYLLVSSGAPHLVRGWAIPAATDIAFAIGVLALLGSRAPTSLKLFLLTVAIVDDMGAVAIIAIVYTGHLDFVALACALALLAALFGLNRAKVCVLWPYLLLAFGLWVAILLSGVHATIAGVLAAMTIPIARTPGAPDSTSSPLHRLEHAIAPAVAFLIVPLFGFANAGVSLDGIGLGDIFAPLPLAVAAGLFVGKQIGILASVWLCVRLGIAGHLRGATWLQVYGIALLCGIGFTMSLFIGALAFPARPELVDEAKIGILMGSLVSALAGYTMLRLAPLHPEHDRIERGEAREMAADGDVATTEEAR